MCHRLRTPTRHRLALPARCAWRESRWSRRWWNARWKSTWTTRAQRSLTRSWSLAKVERVSDISSKVLSGALRLAVPSDGELYKDSLEFLGRCGIPVQLPNPRRYTGVLQSMPNVAVILQRTADITTQVESGSAELAITGIDRYYEFRRDGSDAVVVIEDLGFGRCDLVLAVPDEWLDVSSIADLADLSVDFQDKGRELRIATKYPRLVERYLLANDIYYFTLVRMSGALEAAPAIGTADLVADITASGNTMRANGLKQISEGTVRVSQACLIANKALLAQNGEALELARGLLTRIEGHLKPAPDKVLTRGDQSAGESPAYQQLLRYINA
ncbi:MAG: ATP phosphoribosyltransferase [Dehalococcoidia bacterium]|nr:ATP phosphoribosyltransferase [Dehalococcoidia bacterium]